MSELIDNLKKFLDSEEGQAHLDRWAAKMHRTQDILDTRSKALHEHLTSLPDEKFEEILARFIKWEKKLENYEYDVKHRQSTSLIFGVVCNMFENYGTCPMHYPGESFLGEVPVEYRGILLKTYHGQGTFHRLVRDENIIFQTT